MNLNDFHFIRPFCLLAFIPYLVVLALLIRSKLNQGNWSAVCDAELLPYLLENKAVRQNRWPLISGALAGLLAIFALAGPTWERLPAPAFRNDSALVILLDLSRSMQAEDLKPSRLVMARYKISDILKQRKDGQTALIAYSGDAFTVTPLTTDTETIDNQLAVLTPDIMPSDGNNLSRALDKAVGLFKQAGLQKGQILLLTDGGELDEGISKAKTLGDYQLLVLGVGSADGAPIALPSGDFLKDSQGNIIIDKVDTGGLEKLAQASGGSYHALTPDDSDINALLTAVNDKLQAQAGKNANLLLEQWRDQGPWVLLAVLPLAALCFRKGVLTVLLCFFLPWPKPSHALDLNWQDLWQTKDQQAQQAYKQGDYAKAAELFENPDWKAAANYKSGAYDKALKNLKEKSNANSLYNQGNALAQSGQLEQALESYKQALKLKPDDNDALYNKELVEKELEKQKQENKQDQNQQNKDDKKDPKDNSQQNKDDKSSGQSDQQKQDSQQSGEQNQKPGQKPEQSQEDLEKQAEKKEADDKKKSEAEQQAQAQEAKKDDQEDKNKPEGEPVPAEMSKEEQQASEQWLKRIPDDPSGLLRRKFKYQYDQRGQQ